ncbi:MAG TPA: hypothetical protein VHL34_24940 [Rhizomicrobium sp.]|jgi:hypothetical protein|nr:hypothetical protein [Rhizomicrobium sp.]
MADRKSNEWEGAQRLPYDTNRQAFDFGRALGLAEAVEALKDMPEALHGLPGFATAAAALEAKAASLRADAGIRNLRFAASKGIDVSKHVVAADIEGILVRPMDLVEVTNG